MELFTDTIESLRSFMSASPHASVRRAGPASWPAGRRSIVFREDTGLELGGPRAESTSAVLWTGRLDMVRDGLVTLVGPDLTGIASTSLPFGIVTVAGITGCTEDNVIDLHRELELVPFELELEGFMLRSASLQHKPWCRISKRALERGFDAATLASSLMALYRKKPWVLSVETFVVTASDSDVRSMASILENAFMKTAALYKMAFEPELECESCEHQDVCDQADELRRTHARRVLGKGAAGNA
ncbi:MAG TPA: hypothetical protein PLW83_00280 [Deltaproteobacteria bacterium]|mgnify:FL=1|nr:hypothetical protein [Deltaproteobacteria bacterium]